MGTSKRFAGEVALVTGAGHGIGRSAADLLGREGARIAILDRDSDAALQTVKLLESAGTEARAWTADVSNERDVATAVTGVLSHFGRIDVLHANAGIPIPGTVVSHTIEEWDRTFAVNVRGAFLTARAVVPSMLEQGSGSIVFTASISGMVGERNAAAYDASKAAIISLTRQMAVEYGRNGIRVNCICPGWVETGFNDPWFATTSEQELDEMVDAAIPLGRQATADDIAPCVAFLASDDARYVTGHALVIDGGLVAT
jgi:meso-butanediol dehydrogenase / (S,S)-butanediol dehydrogenase / diacetyl reductase